MSTSSTSTIAEALYDLSRSTSQAQLAEKIAAFISKERRSKDLPAILRAFERLRFERDGIIEAKVQSVFPLSEGTKRSIIDMLESEFSGKTVKVHIIETITPELLSGVRISALGKEFDSSASTRLLKFKGAAHKAS